MQMQMQIKRRKGRRALAPTHTYIYIYITLFRKQTISAFAHASLKANIPNLNNIQMTFHLFDDSEAG